MNACVCCVDLGSSRIKVGLLDAQGIPLASSSVTAPAALFSAGNTLFDAEGYLALVVKTMRAAVEQIDLRKTGIEAVAITSQRATLIPVDAGGVAIGPALSWQNIAGDAALREFLASFGAARFQAITGLPPSAVWTIAKLLWLRAQEAERYHAATAFVLPHDFLAHRLGGQDYVTDPSNASLTGLMDIRALTWSPELLGAMGINEALLPRIQPAGARIGAVSADAAAATGIPAGVPILNGGGDQQCATLGAGVLDPGHAALCLGTGAIANCPIAYPPEAGSTHQACTAHVVPGTWILEGIHNTFGASLRWMGELFGALSAEALEHLASTSGFGANGILFLPFLAGIGAPDYDAGARGALLGLHLSHRRGDAARAVYEGNCLEVRRIIDALAACVPIVHLTLVCGGASNQFLGQLLADLVGRSLRVRQQTETGLIGTAILAWTGLGRFSNVQEGAAACVPPVVRELCPALPDAQREALFDRYNRWVEAIRTGEGFA